MRAAGTWDESAQTETTTVCAYCGVGCNLTLHVQDNEIVKVTSPDDNPVTHGNLCIKGRFGYQHVQNRTDQGLRVTERRKVIRIREGAVSTRPDTLVAEEPLEIRLNGKPLAITMRTPGDDFALAASSSARGSSAGPTKCRTSSTARAPLSTAPTRTTSWTSGPRRRRAADITLERNVYTTSSCGLCGKASLDVVVPRPAGPSTTASTLPRSGWSPLSSPASPPAARGPAGLRPDRGLHAAALFTVDREMLDVREDVGRHNAVDKLVGRALQRGDLPLSRTILLVSGRASFELAQRRSWRASPCWRRSRHRPRWRWTWPPRPG